MMTKPRIGVTCGVDEESWKNEGPSWQPYAQAVARAGGIPVALDPATRGREREVLGGLQGVLFTGGKDVDLAMYPSPPHYPGETYAEVMARLRMLPEPDRDEYELPLLQEAVQQDVPVLGICRGCQVLNVALGGRLVLDISLETGTPLRHEAFPAPERLSSGHALQIQPESDLARILAPERFRICNSRHHQSVRADQSPAVRVAALSPEDSIVEAIELPGRRWAYGVQWHPEHARDHEIRELYAPLFTAFVAAAS